MKEVKNFKNIGLGTLKKVFMSKGKGFGDPLSRAPKTERKRDWHPIIQEER